MPEELKASQRLTVAVGDESTTFSTKYVSDKKESLILEDVIRKVDLGLKAASWQQDSC